MAGTETTWQLTVSNSGPNPAVGPIVITDTLPSSVDYESIWNWLVRDRGRRRHALTHAGPLASGASLSVSVTGSIEANGPAGTSASNTACVESETLDLAGANDCATDPGTVTAIADLGISKTATASDYIAGEDIEVGGRGA